SGTSGIGAGTGTGCPTPSTLVRVGPGWISGLLDYTRSDGRQVFEPFYGGGCFYLDLTASLVKPGTIITVSMKGKNGDLPLMCTMKFQYDCQGSIAAITYSAAEGGAYAASLCQEGVQAGKDIYDYVCHQ